MNNNEYTITVRTNREEEAEITVKKIDEEFTELKFKMKNEYIEILEKKANYNKNCAGQIIYDEIMKMAKKQEDI